MPGPFTVTAATNSIQLDTDRQGEASFTVFNGSGRPLRGQARLRAEDPSATGWLSLAGESERDFDIAAAHQFTVRIQVPSDAPAGSYPFRLDMVGVEDPDEEYSEGPTVTFQVPEPEPEKEPFPWWIVGIVAGVLVVAGIILAIVIGGRGGTATVPRVRGETLSRATTLIEDEGLEIAAETRQEPSDDVAANRVIETDPPAGTKADRGSEVTLIVSSGSPVEPTEEPTEEPPEPDSATITFDAFPDGTPVTTDRILDGDEFQSAGILLAGAPQGSYCAEATATKILVPPHHVSIDFTFLSSSRPDELSGCDGVPVEITFIEPVVEVELTFAGASSTYTMEVYDSAGNLIQTVDRQAVYGGGTTVIGAGSSSGNIKRVVFGKQASITAIQQIWYKR
jgi:hypothetical protein